MAAAWLIEQARAQRNTGNKTKETNMSNLAVTFGISGSGKSQTSAKFVAEGYTRICPDDIRKEVTSSISDQSKNGYVFELAFARTLAALRNGEDVIFDSTGLQARTRRQLRDMAKQVGATTTLINLVSSKNKEVCQTRVRKDLALGVDRSDTLVNEDIIERQYNNYIFQVNDLEKEGWNEILTR
jgi:predicted kinase